MATILYRDPSKMTPEEIDAEIAATEARIAEKEGRSKGEKTRYGAMVGSAIGGIAGQRIGGLPGDVIGSGVGGAAGEFGEQLYRGEDINLDTIKNAGLENAAGSLAGDIGTRAAFKAISPYGHRLAADAKEVVANLKEYGGYPTLNMLVKSGPVKYATRMAEQGMGAADKMTEYMEESVIQPTKRYGKAVARSIGNYLEPEARGNTGKNLIKLGHSLFKDSVRPLYKEADDLFAMPVVPKTDKIKQTAIDYIRHASDPQYGAETFGSKAFLAKAKKVLEWPDHMYFEKAHNERSSLLGMSLDQKELMNSYDEAFVKKMTNAISEAMEEGATRAHEIPYEVTTAIPERSMFGPTKFTEYSKTHTKVIDPKAGFKAYRTAADKYAEGAAIYDDVNIVGIITSKDGVKAAGKMLPPKSPEVVNKVMAAITKYNPSDEAKQYIKDLRASWFEDVLERKGLDVGKESQERLGVELQDKFSQKFNAERILDEFNKYGETYDILAGENKAEIARFFRTIQAIERHSKGGGPGQVFIAMKYAQAPGLLLSGAGGVVMLGGNPMAGVGMTAAGAGIMVTPPVLAKVLTSKTALKLLTNTIITPERQALRETGRMLGRVYSNLDQETKQDVKSTVFNPIDTLKGIPSNF